MSAFDILFGQPWGFSLEPNDMRALNEQELNARAMLMAPLMRQAQNTNYEALRNAFHAHDAWQMATLDERYRDFCGCLKLAIERHHAHSDS